MSNRSNEVKAKQLGMPIGTATAILRKNVMFSLIKQLNLDVCFQCGERIDSVEDLSIEHKVPWLNSVRPKELFYSLDNIAFSHLNCNSGAARRKTGLNQIHGTLYSYMVFNCRCSKCRQAKAEENKRNRK